MAQADRLCSRLEPFSLFLFGAAPPLWIGHRLLFRCGYVDWGALYDVARAFDVFRLRERPQISLIGFADPPLPAILQLPFAGLCPGLSMSGYAACVAMAVMAGAMCVALNALLRDIGLGRAARLLFVAVWGLSPLVLYWGASGRGEMLLALVTTLGLRQIVLWRRDKLLRDALLAGLIFALAPVVRYEAIFLVAAVSVAVAVLLRKEDGAGWSQIEGVLIAFLLPTLYVVGLWVLTKWAIVGSPFSFWADSFGAPAEETGCSGVLDAVKSVFGVLWSANSALPLFLPAAAVALMPLGSRDRLLCTTGGVGLSVPLYFGLLAADRLPGSGAWREALARPSVALFGLLFGLVLSAGIWASDWWRSSASRADRLKVALGALLALGSFAGAGEPGESLVADAAHNVRLAVRGDTASLAAYTIEKRVAAETLAYVGGEPVLIRGELSFAVRLFSGRPRQFVLPEDLANQPVRIRWLLQQMLPAGPREGAAGVGPHEGPRMGGGWEQVADWGYWRLLRARGGLAKGAKA